VTQPERKSLKDMQVVTKADGQMAETTLPWNLFRKSARCLVESIHYVNL
jgi:hypothetical protein